jgi:hypothetical protein
MAANPQAEQDARAHAWRGFRPGPWQTRINTLDPIYRDRAPQTQGDRRAAVRPDC